MWDEEIDNRRGTWFTYDHTSAKWGSQDSYLGQKASHCRMRNMFAPEVVVGSVILIASTLLTRKEAPRGGVTSSLRPTLCTAWCDEEETLRPGQLCRNGISVRPGWEAPTKAFRRAVSQRRCLKNWTVRSVGCGANCPYFTKHTGVYFPEWKVSGMHCDTCFLCENSFKLC